MLGSHTSTELNTVKKVKLSPKTPLRHTGQAEIQSYSPLHSALDGSQWSISHPDRFTLGKNPRHPLNLVVWAPEPVWTVLDDGKSHVPVGIRTPDRPSRSAVTVPILTEFERTWNELAMVRFEVLPWRLAGGTDRNHEIPQQGQSVFRPSPKQKSLPETPCSVKCCE
jgi:hypothetical protein